MPVTQSEEFFAAAFLSYVFVFALIYFYKDKLTSLIKRVFEKDRIKGSILYVAITSIAITLFAPITPFNVLAMYIYKPPVAFGMSLIAHIIGASLQFYISRKLEPTFLKKEMDKNEVFKLLSSKEQSKDISGGDWILLSVLTRASPSFPYAMVSYLWGFTKISYINFIVGTILGCIPYLLGELYIIYNATHLLERKGNYKFTILAIIVTIALIFVIEEVIKKILDTVKVKKSI